MSERPVYLAPEHIRRIVPYRPGPPIDSVRRQLGRDEISLLASNENTYGPAPRAVEAIRQAANGVHLYPDGGGYALRHRLAQVLGVAPEAVVLGNGSGELVGLFCQAFVMHGEAVVVSRYGFVQYLLSAQKVGARIVQVGEPAVLADDLPAMAQAANEQRARIVFLANPNNPTGTYASRAQLDAYFEAIDPAILTVVDQAYFEYAVAEDYPDALEDLAAGRNVAVLRTFSKIYGLAGLRIGYAVAAPALIEQIEKVRLPFNTNSLGQLAALAALDDDEYVQRSRHRNLEERAFLAGALRQRDLCCVPSQANFLLVDVGRPASELCEGLLARGVLCRPMAGYGLPTHVRVTVGQRQESERLLAALGELGFQSRTGRAASEGEAP
jgi:histidinol-phosphate aminotransferase